MVDALTPHQEQVVKNFLDEEKAKRDHVIIHLTGAHAYGFASVDSDVDLKAIHCDPTERFLGFPRSNSTANRLEFIEDVEVDYTSNEIGPALRGMLKGDGNMLERVMSDSPVHCWNHLDDLRELTKKNVSLKFYNHYKGFAMSQRKAYEASDKPSAKKALYVLRTTMTGVHLLTTGHCVPDLTKLAPEYGCQGVDELIDIKRSEEKGALPADLARSEVPKLLDWAFERLEQAQQSSKLPDEPPFADELEKWLIDLRIKRLQR